jgi:hypothetical protein
MLAARAAAVAALNDGQVWNHDARAESPPVGIRMLAKITATNVTVRTTTAMRPKAWRRCGESSIRMGPAGSFAMGLADQSL